MTKNRAFTIKESDAKKFIEDSNKHVISNEFLQKCIEASYIFNNDNTNIIEGNDQPSFHNIEEIVKSYLKDNLKLTIRRRDFLGGDEAIISIKLGDDLISQVTLVLS